MSEAIQTDRLLPWDEVRPMVGDIGRSTAWRMQNAGVFPAPVRVSPNRVAWRLSDIQNWQAARSRTMAAA